MPYDHDLNAFYVALFGSEDARNAAYLQVAVRKRGRQLTTIDAQLVAIREDATLLTTDTDFEAVETL